MLNKKLWMMKASQTYVKFSALLSQSKVEKGDAAKMCATCCTHFRGKNLKYEDKLPPPNAGGQ
jgi:hypothetical protein